MIFIDVYIYMFMYSLEIVLVTYFICLSKIDIFLCDVLIRAHLVDGSKKGTIGIIIVVCI